MKEELRPCIVTIIEWNKKPIDRRVFPEKRKAYFHKWTGKKEILGIVEYEDGRIDTVKPQQIVFTDRTKPEINIDTDAIDKAVVGIMKDSCTLGIMRI